MEKQQEQGFLTLETLYITTALVVVLSIVGVYMQGCKMVAGATNLTTATCLAQKQLAWVEADQSLISSGQTDIAWRDPADSLPLERNGTIFTVATIIQDSSVSYKLKEIVIAVVWHEFGVVKQISVATAVWVDG